MMKIENDEDYNFALKRLQEIFDAPIGTPESEKADELAKRIDEYEQTHYPIDSK
ncbi:hypothetical protein AQPE_2907 [Aquipluma nitroreducens]|uniref:Uncharacterized protein n=1 Tax=Aquipluma nitroreducens TaxID=2010828 RepID=A0A5K7SB04_9BACT|nr:hypothetical protein [Aquipluma nitroreducens]BBE18742.1 hypothetical protein AQPE_2907 [Aquipluma nitroreducens]